MPNKEKCFNYAFSLLLIVFANLATLHAQSAERYNVAALRNVMVAARDGVKLATDVYLPARNSVIVNGRFPAIVERTPYNKNDVSPTLIEYFVTRGYAVVT